MTNIYSLILLLGFVLGKVSDGWAYANSIWLPRHLSHTTAAWENGNLYLLTDTVGINKCASKVHETKSTI